MNAKTIIATLRAYEPELRAACAVRLSLFGSTARGEARPDSDIDLLAAFDEALPLSLLDVIGIENRISDLLGRVVDLVEEGSLEPSLRQPVDREAVRAFWFSGSMKRLVSQRRGFTSVPIVQPATGKLRAKLRGPSCELAAKRPDRSFGCRCCRCWRQSEGSRARPRSPAPRATEIGHATARRNWT